MSEGKNRHGVTEPLRTRIISFLSPESKSQHLRDGPSAGETIQAGRESEEEEQTGGEEDGA